MTAGPANPNALERPIRGVELRGPYRLLHTDELPPANVVTSLGGFGAYGDATTGTFELWRARRLENIDPVVTIETDPEDPDQRDTLTAPGANFTSADLNKPVATIRANGQRKRALIGAVTGPNTIRLDPLGDTSPPVAGVNYDHLIIGAAQPITLPHDTTRQDVTNALATLLGVTNVTVIDVNDVDPDAGATVLTAIIGGLYDHRRDVGVILGLDTTNATNGIIVEDTLPPIPGRRRGRVLFHAHAGDVILDVFAHLRTDFNADIRFGDYARLDYWNTDGAGRLQGIGNLAGGAFLPTGLIEPAVDAGQAITRFPTDNQGATLSGDVGSKPWGQWAAVLHDFPFAVNVDTGSDDPPADGDVTLYVLVARPTA